MQAQCIAVLPFEVDYLRRGHAVHPVLFFPSSRGWLWLRELIPPHANRGRAVVPITGAAARDAIQIRDIRHEGESAAFEAISLVEGGLGLFAISGHVASIRRSLGQSGSSGRWALDRTRAIGTG